MVADILMAFVVALSFELFCSIGKMMKSIMVLVCCITMIATYFIRGLSLNFIGSMDLSVWMLFVIAFMTIFSILEQWFVRIFKEMKKDGVCLDEIVD